MARRFYDSGLIQQRWYMELAPTHKALYIHLLCACDNAGIFEVNPIMMTAFIGAPVREEDIYSVFGNRVKRLSESKGIMVDFAYFQCGGELKEGCRPHDAIVKRLNEVGISVEDLQKMCTHELKYTSVAKPPAKSEEESILKAKYSASVGSVVANPYKEDFADEFGLFWAVYPRRDGKATSFIKFSVIMKNTKESEREGLLDAMLKAIAKQKQSEQWSKDNGKYIPMPATWLNQKRWEDEGIVEDKVDESVASANVKNILGGITLS